MRDYDDAVEFVRSLGYYARLTHSSRSESVYIGVNLLQNDRIDFRFSKHKAVYPKRSDVLIVYEVTLENFENEFVNAITDYFLIKLADLRHLKPLTKGTQFR